jgi:nucleoside-diphosphate-sugar epimerase
VSAPRDILLVGGTGFMGAHAARGLAALGHRVTVVSRGRRPGLPGVAHLTADRADPDRLVAALGGRRFDLAVDFLVFDAPDLGWVARVPAGTLGRYVMISTGQVYLVGEGGEPPFVEDDARQPLRPEPIPGTYDHASWAYGVGKRRAEQAMLALREGRGLQSVALRLPIVQGEQDGSLRLWGYLERMLDGGPLVLPDGGLRPVRHLDAGDLAPVLARLADPAPLAHPAYNLAQPEPIRLRDLLARVAEAAGAPARFADASWERCREAGLDESFSPYGGRWASVLDPSRAAAGLGFAGTSVERYLPRVVRWHLDHRPPSHPGYALRARELELAATLTAAGGVS